MGLWDEQDAPLTPHSPPWEECQQTPPDVTTTTEQDTMCLWGPWRHEGAPLSQVQGGRGGCPAAQTRTPVRGQQLGCGGWGTGRATNSLLCAENRRGSRTWIVTQKLTAMGPPARQSPTPQAPPPPVSHPALKPLPPVLCACDSGLAPVSWSLGRIQKGGRTGRPFSVRFPDSAPYLPGPSVVLPVGRRHCLFRPSSTPVCMAPTSVRSL